MQDLRSMYRLMFERSPLPMWMYDTATLAFVDVNEAAILHYGYSRDELLRMTIADIRPAEDLPALEADVRAASNLTPGVWRHRKKNGEIISVEITANDFTAEDRNLRLVLAKDVTDRLKAERALRRTEEQLRHAQKMDAIGQLAGGVAHDLNNILTVIMTYASLLADDPAATAGTREEATEIRRAADRGAAIARQLLAFSRRATTKIASIDVDEVVQSFAVMLRRFLGVGIEISVHSRAELPSILADASQLEQVILNLAINARDAMPDGGKLVIETGIATLDASAAAERGIPSPGTFVVIAVTDTGIGMEPAVVERIFEPFFTTKDAGKGTGLGLAIVHGIVTQAHGGISVYSEPGHGTTFRVYLPAADHSVTATASAASPETTPDVPPIAILIVDDNTAVRGAAARVLSAAGCTVLEAATADEARRICVRHEGPIDLVLVDVVLPDHRGDLLVGELVAIRPDARTVLVSGYPAGALLAGDGLPDLLSKPFSPTELRAAVARAAAPQGTADGGAPPRASEPRPFARVLIADDDDTFRRTMARLLRRSGFEVTEADRGSHAIAALRAGAFDVVVSDIHMPEGTGIDLLRAVRAVDLDAPVILMTGLPDVQLAASAVEHGAFRFLTKPVDGDAMIAIVQHAARARALARVRRDALAITGGAHGPVDRAGLEVRFESALANVWLAQQPIVDARTAIPVAIEALLRSDETSMATPPLLLDAATQLGRLPQLGRVVRATAAATLAARTDSLDLFVNLHPEDLFDAELVDEARPLTRIASRVVLEVTERSSLAISPALSRRLARLRELGFRIAIDDIGAGYSGLTSFTEIAPELVKIDMSLVRDAHISALKQRTIAALCKLCHDIGARVVAEGIESAAERDCVVSLGCDLLQGYLLGRPTRAT